MQRHASRHSRNRMQHASYAYRYDAWTHGKPPQKHKPTQRPTGVASQDDLMRHSNASSLVALAAAAAACSTRGCTCEPEIRLWADEHGPRITIEHDPDCPTLTLAAA